MTNSNNTTSTPSLFTTNNNTVSNSLFGNDQSIKKDTFNNPSSFPNFNSSNTTNTGSGIIIII
jgi:hypothetical protein